MLWHLLSISYHLRFTAPTRSLVTPEFSAFTTSLFTFRTVLQTRQSWKVGYPEIPYGACVAGDYAPRRKVVYHLASFPCLKLKDAFYGCGTLHVYTANPL